MLVERGDLRRCGGRLNKRGVGVNCRTEGKLESRLQSSPAGGTVTEVEAGRRGEGLFGTHKFGGDGFTPEAIAFFVGVEEVGHEGAGKDAFRGEVAGGDVATNDNIFFCKGGNEEVDFVINLTLDVIFVGTAGEDIEDGDFCLGAVLAEVGHDGFDAFKSLLEGGVGVVAGVIGANHKHDAFGGNNIPVNTLDAPKDVLGSVATEAEIEGVAEELFLQVRCAFIPKMGNRVADKDRVMGVFRLGFFRF